MKKLAAILVMMAACINIMADDFTYLTVENSDGTTTSMTASGLTITFADGQLKASNGSETWALPLSSLSKMYFSNTDGISEAAQAIDDGEVTAYSTYGIVMGTFSCLDEARSQLKKGIYVIKSGSRTIKITVR